MPAQGLRIGAIVCAPRGRNRASVAGLLILCMAALAGCAEPLAKPQLTLPEVAEAPELRLQPSRGPANASQLLPVSTEQPAAPEVFAAAQQSSGQAATVAEEPAAEGYRTVGGVLAEVNGRPIFTDEVIDAVRNDLRGRALQQADKQRFLQEARNVIAAEVDQRISDEVLRLVAERNLTPGDRERALFAATQFRVNRITAAGGSEARARQIAFEETGLSLEKLVEQTEKEFLVILFVQAVILPRAEPSAEEMREYFLRHQDQFSGEGKGEIEFQLIELNAGASSSSPEELQARAEHVRSLAASGEDFAALAAQYNDNPDYKAAGGTVPGMPLGRGDFRWPAVDAAAWQTAAGAVTPVISEDGGRRLFIARVVRKTEPEAVGFDKAQERIREAVRNDRRISLMRQYQAEAAEYAAITPDEKIDVNLGTAVEVVSQQYEAWRAQ